MSDAPLPPQQAQAQTENQAQQPSIRPSGLFTFWKDWLEPIIFAVVITQFLVTMVAVDGVSMMPNLRDGERVIVPKYEGWLHRLGVGSYQRGDIVVFKPPRQAAEIVPSLKRDFLNLWEYRPFLIKRVIGLPGDRVRIEAGDVWVNNQPLNSAFTTAYWQEQGCWDRSSQLANQATTSLQGVVPDQLEITVPAGHFFVMGDNRTVNGSEDSRAFGTVPMADIAGRAALVVWPIMRPSSLGYDCTTSSAQNPSADSERAWRLLPPPPAFEDLEKALSQ